MKRLQAKDLAGVNAARKIQNKSEIILTRDNSYIGVMIDDIINKRHLSHI